MTSTTFEKAKIGDRVYSHTFGWGVIDDIIEDDDYPIHVLFDDNCDYFTMKGFYYKDKPVQCLFWNECTIEAPIKPKPMKIINGFEIPNISFKPNSGDHCYIPTPTHPYLCMHLYYCFNETNKHLRDNNLCYPYTEEGKQAAILHAKAMLGMNPLS
jgi:hypothetical protein